MIPDSDEESEDAGETEVSPEIEPLQETDDDTIAQRPRIAPDRNPFHLTVMQNPAASDQGGSEALPQIRSADDFDRAFGQDRQRAKPRKRGDGEPPAEIRIEVDEDGNLMLISPDTEALDRLENLMLQVAPPKRPYHVFHIKHATAFWMRLNLEDYYKDLEEGESEADVFYRWWNGYQEDEDSGPTGLGKGVKLRFVDDPDTNTLVVTGATTSQLRTIAELIELWDVPEPVNKRKTRFTDLVEIKYGQAQKIADTVKEAYRDLLSSNDKVFTDGRQQGQGGGQKPQASKSRNGNGSGFRDSDGNQDAGGTNFSFKGKLSIGVDDIGNTLLISAEGEPLLNLVKSMITRLDDAARPASEVQVIRIPGSISTRSLQLALQAMGAEAPDDLQTVNRSNRDARSGDRNQLDRRRNVKFQDQRRDAD